MYRISYAALTVCFYLTLASCFEQRAYAYVDPGSGILACQAIGAFFTGTFFYFRKRLKDLMQTRPAEPKGLLEKGAVRNSARG